ncbi:MAG: UDP-N-acetylglucosamine diphosphorylase [Defluviitaleaceae bacterium]|nr:UDP-N-acetylglucosamine diphosphorylase [Defluviitaleaceae bacterium]
MKKQVENGIIYWDLANTFISEEAVIGTGTEILPGVIIEGSTIIGENCKIGPNTRLIDMQIGDNVEIQYTVAEKSKLAEGCKIGPFAYIRPGSNLGKNVKIGDFVEVKNTIMGEGSKANHLSYLGDAVVGAGVNIGCGTITVNYDGADKHTTTIEDGAFVGCNSNLIAPVTVGKDAFVAAGSTISKNVPASALGVARAKQINMENWESPKQRKMKNRG